MSNNARNGSLQEAGASFYMAPITPFVYWRPKSGRLTQIFADVSNSSQLLLIKVSEWFWVKTMESVHSVLKGFQMKLL